MLARIRTAKANSSRRAARMAEYISHVKVMIIVDNLLTSAVASTGSNCARGVCVRTVHTL